MSKSNKLGKVIVLGALAGAAAYGVYTYLQKKNEVNDDCVVDGEEAPKKRSYVSLDLDSAKEYATATYEKAKDALKKVESKIEESGVFKRSSAEETCAGSDDETVDSDIEPVDEEMAEDFDQDLPAEEPEKPMEPTSSEEFFDEPDAE